MIVRREAVWLQWIGVLLVVIGPASAARRNAGHGGEAGWDVSERFAFVWDSVEVSAQLFSPTYAGHRDLDECQRKCTVIGKIHVLDANDLVGMQVVDPDVLHVVDDVGKELAWSPLLLRPLRQYQKLDYSWAVTRDSPLGARVEPVLQPYHVSVAFCIDRDQKLPSSLSLFEWCAFAVYAEAIIEVDVPFEASDDWLEAAPGLQIRVTKAMVECCDYTYWTEVKHPGGIVRAFDDRTHPTEPIADYLVMRTLLLDAEGKPVEATEDDRVSPAIWSEHVYSTPLDTAKCGGWLLTFVTQAEIASIRHVIVVHPYEVRVPFAVHDLPLPGFGPDQ
ncbi:MAG: hypothetical protein RBR19_17925 [Sedimentisphaerales bacterium]|jgi:hypothetical protein|nr:hypothetical protein [Sedimentisphaerales bacterium]NLT77643.1 hypothetical protein [Planctomycetota bacterium]